MKKGRTNMYEMMIKDRKKNQNCNKNFFMEVHVEEIGDIKALVSRRMIDSLSRDMLDMADFMTQTIMEGLVDGRK